MVTETDVRQAFSAVPGTDFHTHTLEGNQIQVTVSEKNAGLFYKTLRQSELDFNSKRLGSTLVAQIEIEEQQGLGRLFQK